MSVFSIDRILTPQRVPGYVEANARGRPVRKESSRLEGSPCAVRFECPSGFQEVARIGEDMALLTSDFIGSRDYELRDTIEGHDWIHIQLRLSGGGSETIDACQPVETRDRTCIVSRYSAGSSLHRILPAADHWRAICFYFRPGLLRKSLRLSADFLADEWQWLDSDRRMASHSATFALSPSELVAANDVFQCRLVSDLRRVFVAAKATELLAYVLSRFSRQIPARPAHGLSRSEERRIIDAHNIIGEDVGATLTLDQLARKVGTNRTKLASGFKALYGVSVQAHWRELRLQLAHEYLSVQGRSVSDTAFEVGYSDVSSLTRCYLKRFGILPSQARSLHRAVG